MGARIEAGSKTVKGKLMYLDATSPEPVRRIRAAWSDGAQLEATLG